MSWLLSMFRGKTGGKVSITRVCTFLAMVDILVVYTAHNIKAVMLNSPYVDFPSNTVMVILIILGAKVGQHVSEANSKNPESVPSDNK